MTRVRARRLLGCLAATAVLLGAHAPLAAADGDPASDILVGTDAFLPVYPSAPAKPAARTLKALLATARKRRTTFKVAVIATPTDLGAITVLFHQPQRYATFLSSEIIEFLRHDRATLVVVMPGGTGVAGPGATPAARRAAASVQIPANASATALTLKAIDVVQAVARAQGRALPHVAAPAAAAPGGAGDSGGSRATPWILVGCAIVLAVGGALIVVGLRWQRTA